MSDKQSDKQVVERQIIERAALERAAKRRFDERRSAVRRLALAHRDWSQRRLMREAAVSHYTVKRVLAELKDPRA